MTINIKKIALIIMLAVLVSSGFLYGSSASAATCANARVEFVFREPNSMLAENVSWSLHKQERNIDAKRYLGRAVRSGRTDESGSITFEFNPFAVFSESKRGGSNVFALKVYELNAGEGEEIFWDVIIPCGRLAKESFTLSTLTVVIRDQQGMPIINQPFHIYSQRNSFDGTPIVDKLVSNRLSTGISGYKTVHLATGAYIIRIPTPTNRGKFYEETNVIVRSKTDNTFDYRTGNLRVTITDATGNPVTNSTVNLFTQNMPFQGVSEFGKKEASVRTNSNGVATFFQPEGIYGVQVFGPNRSVYDFYNITIRSESNNSIKKKLSMVEVLTRDANGSLTNRVRMSLYEQKVNADGVLFKGKLIVSAITNDAGLGQFYISPGAYVFNAGGENQYNVIVKEGEVTSFVYRVPDTATAKSISSNDVLVKGVTFEIIPHGSVAKSRSSNKVYFIEKGKKRVIPNEATFFAYGFTWPEVRIISTHDLEHYPTSLPLPELPIQTIKNGSLAKSDQKPAVYIIEEGKKRVFTNGYSFEVLGFRYKDIVTVATFVLDQYRDGSAITIPVGVSTHLIKAEDSSAVYRVENGLKRPYANEAAFLAEGKEWNEVRVMPFSEIRKIPLGAVIS